MIVPVYDILNCGPRHRFVANGKLVHNSQGVNLQNLPRKGELRGSITAPEGHSLIPCDLSQIEARMLAWVAGQEDLVRAFANKQDVYSEFATDIYGVPVTKADEEKRFTGKTCILGLGYMTGAEKLRHTLAIGQGGVKVNIPIEEAKRIVQLYRSKNHRIVAFWRVCDHAIQCLYNKTEFDMLPGVLKVDAQGVRLPNGMYLTYPGLRPAVGGRGWEYISDMRMHRRNPENGWTKLYGGKLCENIIQALARIVIVEYMYKVSKRYRVVMQVHDEIIACVPDELVETARAFIERVMRIPPKWAPGLPVDCESGVGKNYRDAK